MGTNSYVTPAPPMPGKAALTQEPTFLTTLQRITEREDGYLGPGIENEYSKMDPANCDGTLVVLRGNTAAFYLYDAVSCKLLRQIKAFDDCDYAEPEPRWDPSNAKVFYYPCNMKLMSYDCGTNTSKTVRDFRSDFPDGAYITTKAEGDASLDRRYWCFMVEDSKNELVSVMCYDRIQDRVLGRKDTGFPDAINWVGMSMSGDYCIVGYEDKAIYTQVFSRDFAHTVTLPDGSAGHGDAALTWDGRDVYVYQNVRTDFISMADMGTGRETRLLRIPFDVNPDIGLHVSGNCNGTRGWALVSTYGAMEPPPGKKHAWMDEQLLMLELTAKPRVWRIAHTQSYTSDDYSGEKNYYAEAFASINTGGTRIYWGSNWRRYSPDYSDAYRVILPDKWPAAMPGGAAPEVR